MDVLYAIHDCALGISPVTSYSAVKDIIETLTVVLYVRYNTVPAATGWGRRGRQAELFKKPSSTLTGGAARKRRNDWPGHILCTQTLPSGSAVHARRLFANTDAAATFHETRVHPLSAKVIPAAACTTPEQLSSGMYG